MALTGHDPCPANCCNLSQHDHKNQKIRHGTCRCTSPGTVLVLSEPFQAPVVAQRRARQEPTEELHHLQHSLHCANLSLWHSRNVQHSDDEQYLKHLSRKISKDCWSWRCMFTKTSTTTSPCTCGISGLLRILPCAYQSLPGLSSNLSVNCLMYLELRLHDTRDGDHNLLLDLWHAAQYLNTAIRTHPAQRSLWSCRPPPSAPSRQRRGQGQALPPTAPPSAAPQETLDEEYDLGHFDHQHDLVRDQLCGSLQDSANEDCGTGTSRICTKGTKTSIFSTAPRRGGGRPPPSSSSKTSKNSASLPLAPWGVVLHVLHQLLPQQLSTARGVVELLNQGHCDVHPFVPEHRTEASLPLRLA